MKGSGSSLSIIPIFAWNNCGKLRRLQSVYTVSGAMFELGTSQIRNRIADCLTKEYTIKWTKSQILHRGVTLPRSSSDVFTTHSTLDG
jgi:hypothetical protein